MSSHSDASSGFVALQDEKGASWSQSTLPADDCEQNSAKPSAESATLRLDKNGLPLVPQPSRFMDDPLVC